MMGSKYAMAFDEDSEINASVHGRPCRPVRAKGSCYLKRPRRSLRQACKDVRRRHGIAAIPCAGCRVQTLCAVSKPEVTPLAEPKPRPRG